jgi:hypothetical protein
VTVSADRLGRPTRLTIDGQRHHVDGIVDDWLIEDEWWRVPVQREYFEVRLADGVTRTVFHDLVGDAWYQQDDPYPLADAD